MIYPYSNETQTRWDRGELQVQVLSPNTTKPLAYCDGTDADMNELVSIAEAEGAEGMHVTKKELKTGRQVWTIGVESDVPEEPIDD